MQKPENRNAEHPDIEIRRPEPHDVLRIVCRHADLDPAAVADNPSGSVTVWAARCMGCGMLLRGVQGE